MILFNSIDGLSDEIVSLIQSGQQHEVIHSLHLKFDRPLAHLFRLIKITDAFGNSRNVDSFYSVDVHDLPRAVFEGCEGSKIREEVESSVDIPLKLTGAEPLTVSMEYRENLEAEDPVLFDVSDMKSGRDYVSVGKPGVYTVKKVKDSYCSRDVESVCIVSRTVAPMVEIKSEPIEQFCVGTIGMLVDVSFTGEPPFWLEYQQTHKGESQVYKVEGIKTSHHVLELKPSHSGTYVYSFLAIGDVNYAEGIDVEIDDITHIIHPQSTAAFRDVRKDRIVKCLGDTVTLPVVLSGSKPWKLAVCRSVFYILVRSYFRECQAEIPGGD